MAIATAGTRLREVGVAVERVVEARGFSVLRDLQGHGVGRAIDEPPEVPSWGAPWASERLTEGLVMTIEPPASRCALVTASLAARAGARWSRIP
jgi:methionyl aminopeptidase